MKHIASPLLKLPEKCICANFVRRIKRFSVQLEHEGQIIWAHTNNTGAMLGLRHPGCLAMLSPATGKNRKLPYTLERIRIGHGPGGFWAGVNTSVPNRLLEAAFHAGRLPFANGYDSIKREAGKGNSRLDAHIYGNGLPDLWVECKNVTLVEDGVAAFPDAASERGRKHLGELMEIVDEGARAAMFYVVQRPDGKCFAPADYIDPEYAGLFYMAMEKGVEMYAFQAIQTDAGTDLGEPLRILPRLADL